jgi:hypothetical protein
MSFIENNAPSPTIKRTMQEGSTINLGYYFPVEGSKYPGWIVKITTRFNYVTWVAVIWDYHKRENRCYELRDIGQSKYLGGQTVLCKGDQNVRA